MKKAPAFKKKMDRAKMKPQDVQAVKDLERLGITEKTDLIGMQKKSPPFGGFNGVPPESLSRIFVSPGPIYEPGEMHYEDTRWAQGLFAGGFRPGDICQVQLSATTWSPLPSCWTNRCAYWAAGPSRPVWATPNSDSDPEGFQGLRFLGDSQFPPCDPATFQRNRSQS